MKEAKRVGGTLCIVETRAFSLLLDLENINACDAARISARRVFHLEGAHINRILALTWGTGFSCLT